MSSNYFGFRGVKINYCILKSRTYVTVLSSIDFVKAMFPFLNTLFLSLYFRGHSKTSFGKNGSLSLKHLHTVASINYSNIFLNDLMTKIKEIKVFDF